METTGRYVGCVSPVKEDPVAATDHKPGRKRQDGKENPFSIAYGKEWELSMFTDYYGFSFNPFNKQNLREKDAFHSRDHKQTLERLEYLKKVLGIGIFTARPGMRKTFCLHCFMNSLNPSQ